MDGTDRLLSLVHSVYAAPGSTEGWRAFLLDLCDAVDANGAQFLSHKFPSQQADVSLFARTEPEAIRSYLAHWSSSDPWAHSPTLARLPSGSVVTGEQLIAHAELKRTAYYAGFARRFDHTRCLAAMIEISPHGVSALSLNGGEAREPFEQADVRLLDALMPHLQRAVQIHRRLTRAEADVAGTAAVLEHVAHGVFILDERGTVTRVNCAASAILAAPDGLVLERGELRCRGAKDTGALRALIQSALQTAHDGSGGGGVLDVQRASGLSRFRVVVAPLPRRNALFGTEACGAVILVTDSERLPLDSEELLKSAWGLTEAEARLARALAEGRSVEQTARHLGIALGTARTRLKTVFQKTGTHRQAQLVQAILRIGLGAIDPYPHPPSSRSTRAASRGPSRSA